MGSVEHPPLSHLICPYFRALFYRKIDHGDSYFRIINIPYHFEKERKKGGVRLLPNLLSNAERFYLNEVESLSYESLRYLSMVRHPLYPLYWCNNKESGDESLCGVCGCKEIGTTFYFCGECNIAYHKECVESPLLIKSLHHPKHDLQLLMLKLRDHDPDLFFQPKKKYRVDLEMLSCSYCDSSGHNQYRSFFYYCFICEFSLDPVCARRPSFPKNYTKRHEHTLNHFPRKADLRCDVCGVISKSLIFVCLQCDFVVHKNCIYLPFVIRISRHDHRLSFTYSLPKRLSCGVCRQKVDGNYGSYSCMKDCAYAVHSKCATRRDVWDGKELEEESEEECENLNSFEVIGDGVIQHFSHSHHMRYEKKTTGILCDEKKGCQACVLPFDGGDVYNCMDSKCEFVLHEACANLPRKKQHMAHPYPFILQVSDTKNCFFCEYCDRFSYGFRYVYCERGESISIDVRCASISEPFDHQCHPHSLFLSNELGKDRPCSMCGKVSFRTLNCIECDFFLCFYCATLPYKVRYEHDEHFFTLSYEENASLSWCEVCEETLEPYKWLYTCNDCGVTFHIACLLGKCALYIRPAQNLLFDGTKFNIILNNSLTRPICRVCRRHCEDKLMFEVCDDDDGNAMSRVCYRHSEVKDKD